MWLNRTLTDTTTYVNTVAPLVTQPAVQNFIADSVTQQIISSVPPQDLAQALLPANELESVQTAGDVTGKVQPIIRADVLQVVQSAKFATLWKTTNRTVHASLVTQLQGPDTEVITLNLVPVVNGVIDELRTTALHAVADHLGGGGVIDSQAATVTLHSDRIVQYQQYYRLFQAGTWAVVALALAFGAGAVWLSVHHAKTLRRILIGVGVVALAQAAILAAPNLVTLPGTDPTTQAVAVAIFNVIVRNLFIASLVLGIVCIAAAITSKVVSTVRR